MSKHIENTVEPLRHNTMNKSPTLHPSRSYKQSLGRFGMTGGLVATLDGSTTSTNKLQTRQTPSTNYTEHIRLPCFASEHTMHRWTHIYIASKTNTQQSVSTAATVIIPLNISCFTAHCTTTDADYCQLNQIIHNTLYGSTTQLQRTATYNMSAMNRRDKIVRSLVDQER